MKWTQSSSGARLLDGHSDDRTRQQAVVDPALFKAATEAQLAAGAEILRADGCEAVRLCRQVSSESKVWAVTGPSGKLLALQEISPEFLRDFFEERIAALSAEAPDALLIQSMSDLDEALIALAAARRVSKLPVGVSMVLGSGLDQIETVLGHNCEDVADRLQDAGADLVGCNCQLPVDEMVLAVRLMRKRSDLPILACPDAGQKELDGDSVVYREQPKDFASKAQSLVSAGANVIGGCCGVGVEHIRQLALNLTSPDA